MEQHQDVSELNQHQFQAMDIIAGRMCPELGGSEDLLEILGFNYYWNCQWKGNGESLDWPDPEQKRTPFSELLQLAYLRYKKPLIISETGHFGIGRVQWLEEITAECLTARKNGVELKGICIYPVTDRPDWDDLSKYCDCGIWDLDEKRNRIPHQEYKNAVIRSHKAFTKKKNIISELLDFLK